jgi:hypothetical protein
MSITRVNQQKIEVYVSMIDDLLQILDRLENCGTGTDVSGSSVPIPVIGKIGISDLNIEIGMEYFLYINLFGPPKEGVFDPSLLNKARRQLCIDSGETTDNWPCNRCATPVCNSCGLCSAGCCNFCKCKRPTGATGATGATGSIFKSLCGKHGCVCPGCATGPSGATGPCSICNDTIYPLGWTGSTQWTLLSDISGETGACSHGATGAHSHNTSGTHSHTNDIDTSAHGPCCRSCGPRQPSGCGRCSCHSRISVASYVMALPVYVDPNGNTVIMQGGNGFAMDSYTYASTGFGGGGGIISGGGSGGGGIISGGGGGTTNGGSGGGTTTGGVISGPGGSGGGTVAGATGASGRIIDTDVIRNFGNLGIPLN